MRQTNIRPPSNSHFHCAVPRRINPAIEHPRNSEINSLIPVNAWDGCHQNSQQFGAGPLPHQPFYGIFML